MSLSFANVAAPPAKLASGNIPPARICALSATKDLVALATGATVPLWGVSLPATKYPPNSTEDNGYAMVDGDQWSGSVQGQTCWVTCGAAISDFRVPLTSDGSGRAIPATFPASAGTTNYYIGYPLSTTTTAGELVHVNLNFTYDTTP